MRNFELGQSCDPLRIHCGDGVRVVEPRVHDFTTRQDEDGRIQMGRGGERVRGPELPHDQLHRTDEHIQRNGRLSVVAVRDEEEGESSYAAGSE